MIYQAYYVWYSKLFNIVNKKGLTDLFTISRFECITCNWYWLKHILSPHLWIEDSSQHIPWQGVCRSTHTLSHLFIPISEQLWLKITKSFFDDTNNMYLPQSHPELILIPLNIGFEVRNSQISVFPIHWFPQAHSLE